MNNEDYMRAALELAKQCVGEDEKIHPKVGAVIVKDGRIIASACRNENGKGSHAEYLAIKKAREAGESIVDATLYTTLEPCTYRSRATERKPCTDHVYNNGIGEVVIGMVDQTPR